MKQRQKGFSPLYIVIMIVVVAVTVGGFYAVRHRNQLTDNANNALAREVDETIANGTPENAVKAVIEQVATEISAEDTAMKMEEEAIELDESYVNDLEAVVNESDL